LIVGHLIKKARSDENELCTATSIFLPL
jgi:hypothetical protein